MSRLYDTIEPTVISEELLTEVVHAQGPKGAAGDLVKKGGVVLEKVNRLRLDYKNILKIDNLWNFRNLVCLQMDNNIIEKIEGLEHLVHLKWLDLSFNNIEKIEGLESLVNLEDLTLFNNRIVYLENLDSLKKMQVLSVGNNKLSRLEDLIYLRRFPVLQSLCLRGNPMCAEEEYLDYIYAFLPKLIYLDYKRTETDRRTPAYEKYQLRVDEVVASEVAETEAKRIAEDQEAQRKIHRDAFIEGMDNENIFELLYLDDPEGRELLTVPELSHSVETFREKFTAQCKALFDYGLTELGKRQTEVEQFRTCITKAKEINDANGKKEIQEFKEYQKNAFKQLEQTTDSVSLQQKIKDYCDQLHQLWYTLMRNEMILAEQLEDVIKEFELSMQDIIDRFIQNVEASFAESRDLQAQFNDRLTDICPNVLERLSRVDTEVNASDALLQIFIDKETIANALQSSNYAHQFELDGMADRINHRAREWLAELLKSLHEREEYERNRARVTEISRTVDAFRQELDSLVDQMTSAS
ncbi:unnamed protein product [Calicophoron daubneyi]|uniref:Dynein regulatory complex subunit 3 n=1 Tax=Calicophoron daubneyi TaxID=300641 RepID=A0AAV2TN84_CALDB